jgi:CheY-like chemotaxis protein
MHQIVLNLVGNAVHAMRNRKGAIEVTLTHRMVEAEDELRRCPDLKRGAEYVVLTVRDDGVGMDAATLQRVFDPFFTTKPEGEGTGLGLSTVHDIVRAHAGAIAVDSVVDVGTTFALYFPVAQPVRSERKPSIGPGRGQRILFVDDEEPLVYLAKRMLDRLGYTVTGHSDPRAALDDFRARPTQFDVVVTDLSMPTLGGHELAEAVLGIRPDILVVLLTGAIRPEDRAAADRLHVRHVLQKPLTTEELARALDPILKTVRAPTAGASLSPSSTR